ncbi:DEAD/DEAH box helicase [Enemella sp. A6]|uniref:DEAD/DEAH box helicase n=1 Tax=Enemella sp. A6 TaxID=3440152 RepID=UPI003EBAA8DF
MSDQPNLFAPDVPDLQAKGLSPAYPGRAKWGTVQTLRAWQAAALQRYRDTDPKDFLAVATPGAGKTSFALTVASDLLNRRVVDKIIVVAPTEHLKTQWAEAAERVGIALDPDYSTRKGRASADFTGVALTYAGVAVNPTGLRLRTERSRTLVILDEIHHAGDALSWGEAVREAFEPARRRLALTGTPFRSDANPIPFVKYEPDGTGALQSRADYSYGYGQALADGIVRPVIFMSYSGEMNWRTSTGEEISARLGTELTRDLAGQALRTALDPHGAWIPTVLRAADHRLTEVRRHVPDAGGLVIANDQAHAREYAKMLEAISAEKPVVVLSDEPGSSARIAEFSAGQQRWMVAVRMVSEGVDVPRLNVGVYATATGTPLFFAQAIGRFVRARTRGETASVFLPSLPHLLEYAATMERERNHALRIDQAAPDEEQLIAAAQRTETEADVLLEDQWAALGSEADFDRVVFDGGSFGQQAMPGSEDELEYLGIPGLLEPEQVTALLRDRQAQQVRRTSAASPSGPSTHQRLRDLRKELNGLVAAWHHRTQQPHAVIHSELRKATGGPPSAAAEESALRERIDLIRQWAVSGRDTSY